MRIRPDRQSELPPSLSESAEPDRKQAEVEADSLGTGKATDERAETAERRGRPILVVEPDRRCDLSVRITRSERGGRGEHTFGRFGPPALLEPHAIDEQPLHPRCRP